MPKSLLFDPAAAARPRAWLSRPARRAAAHALGAGSMLLGRLAAALDATHAPAVRRALPPVLEFHAEAGAPEGALYLNGELVGKLHGVRRL